MRVALVAGASGLVGTQCVQKLLASPGYSRVIALVRRRTFPPQAALEERIADLESLNEDHVRGADDVFCAVGTTIRKAGSREAFRKVDHHGVVELGRLAAAGGCATMLLVSSVDARVDSANFYLGVKGDVERDLAKLAFEALHIFRPGLLLGTRTEQRRGEKIGTALGELLAPVLVGRLSKYRPIRASAVAEAMVRAALSGTPGRHIYHYDEIVGLST